MLNDRPLAIDLFCGAGGLSLGFAQAGFNIVAAIDSDPVNIATYGQNFPSTTVICDDISRLSAPDIRRAAGLSEGQPIDVVFGGPPCQGFSLIGKRDITDPRNRLLAEFCRLVRELSPRFFVIENVAGLMCTASRPVLEESLSRLREGNYEWVSPVRILDARLWSAPQRRRRVFVLGFRKGERPPQYPARSRTRSTVWDAISDLRRVSRRRTLLAADVFVGSLGPTTSGGRTGPIPAPRKARGGSMSPHGPARVPRWQTPTPGALAI